jgi:hypothetical protein
MSGSGGFQADLDELSSLANTDIPFIEGLCTDAQVTVQTDGLQNDGTIFEETSSDLYMGLESTFIETRSDLENLLGALSSSLDQCARALREAYRRYAEADGQNVMIINSILPSGGQSTTPVTPIGHKI